MIFVTLPFWLDSDSVSYDYCSVEPSVNSPFLIKLLDDILLTSFTNSRPSDYIKLPG